ncbi:TPA: hypothetical protein IP933_002636 [Listeria monocytogenes]|uniref:hypothetical protein n=1 Tax=Listeria monocytogenes TaxID=1639 RepID=UPI0007756F43|nr:hypothetical protein [Listeria monocytogenes]EAC9604678.1 hypothetical protein [Listeria monocytogenes]EAE7365559.1 hypothetical protein [Listeria monocytogenes]EAF2957721.1 hypothetical protein [Listeria monocytogenes]EAV9832972.1 hypothetical protein [Listeria monocytogenes]EAV9856303.1 hypothetical protein [Listeria monocytogenes]
MKKSIVFGLIGLILVAVATTCVVIQMTADDEPKPKETASKKTKTTKQKPIEIEGGDTEEGSQSEEAQKEKEIRQANQDLIEAYFTYNSTEEQFNHILPLVTETFQEKMKEASGMTDSSVKSKVVSQESYYNQERFFHPTVVNIVTNRVTVNGKSYDQTNYVRFHFTSENNHWKMEDVTITPVAQ